MKRFLSLSDENQFSFTCPVFNAKTKMAACMVLRNLFWGGKRPEKRKGCQAAMECGKCPAAAMVSMISMSHWENDYHGSAEPKEGRLHARILERVARPVIRESVLEQFGVSAAEREIMTGASARIIEQLKTAPGDTVGPKGVLINGEPVAEKASKHKKAAPAIKNEAAASGDLSAAINA